MRGGVNLRKGRLVWRVPIQFNTCMEQPPATPQRHLNWPSKITLVLVGLVLVLLAVAGLAYFKERQQKAGIACNVRLVGMSLKIYANENGGYYPFLDDQWPTANAGFRQLIEHEALIDEKLLGAVSSPYIPDGVIGQAPEFKDAARPGECHWMVTKQSGTFANGTDPLIYDNAIDAKWPLRWRADADGKPVRGRTLFGGMVVICFNDTSVRFIKLKRDGEFLVLPENLVLRAPGFEQNLQVADIEERK